MKRGFSYCRALDYWVAIKLSNALLLLSKEYYHIASERWLPTEGNFAFHLQRMSDSIWRCVTAIHEGQYYISWAEVRLLSASYGDYAALLKKNTWPTTLTVVRLRGPILGTGLESQLGPHDKWLTWTQRDSGPCSVSDLVYEMGYSGHRLLKVRLLLALRWHVATEWTLHRI